MKRIPKPLPHWTLRSQDWESTPVMYDDVASKVAASTEAIRMIVLVSTEEQETAVQEKLRGSNKEYAVRLVRPDRQ